MKDGAFIILTSILLICLLGLAISKRRVGPHPASKDIASCQEFAKHARFNPYSVLDDVWVVFYYWGPVMTLKTYKFSVPSARNKQVLRKYLNDSIVKFPVNWTNPVFVMTEKYTDESTLLVQMGDRGEVLRYPIRKKKLKKNRMIYPEDLNFKQFDNGKYVAYIKCSDNSTFMMAKPRDVPKKLVIQDVAAKLGFRGIKGNSYLYQGHRWMPIVEDNDYEPEMFYAYKFGRHRPDDSTWGNDPNWPGGLMPNDPKMRDDHRQPVDLQIIEGTGRPDVKHDNSQRPDGPRGDDNPQRNDDSERPDDSRWLDNYGMPDDPRMPAQGDDPIKLFYSLQTDGPRLPEEHHMT